MKYYDGHLHIMTKINDFSPLYKNLTEAGIGGGIILSHPPERFGLSQFDLSAAKRLKNLILCTTGHKELHPFFWIDPLDSEAADQVKMAVEMGISGFKVICDHFYPGDPAAMKIFRLIADKGKPILFHSGILWDGMASSKYNRPAEFEDLIYVEGLKFALAHISWPWCDELIALYGKFQAAGKRGLEMFIDTTPGTPPIYRKEALTKLYTVGYDIERNIFFGTDNLALEYDVTKAQEWTNRDKTILAELEVSIEDREGYFSGNLKRFLKDDSPCL